MKAYPHPSLGPAPTYRCQSCRTNGSPDHVPGSELCQEIRAERDRSVRS